MTEPASTNHTATPGRLLARNTVFNLIGYTVPIVIAAFSIPVLIKGLGTERFGVLTLLWMIVGYLSFFDLGAGRATTKFAAEYAARGDTSSLARLIWSSTALLLFFGTVAGVVLAIMNPFLVSMLLKIPAFLVNETVSSFYILATSIPFVLGTSGLRGFLEAQQRFGLINAVKIPVNAASFCAPLLVLYFSHSLIPITIVLVLVRIVDFSVFLFFCLRSVPGIHHMRQPSMPEIKKLLRFGGWLTVSNVIGPLMCYMDRIIVGSFMTMSAVAYYATPYDMVMKLGIIPGSVMGVMFPAMSAALLTGSGQFRQLYKRSTLVIVLLLAPLTLAIIVFAQPVLEMWLGHEFAIQSTRVLQILAVGIFFNSVGQVPYTALQAMGRPDLTAKLHILELPLYLSAILFLIIKAGIVGAALAWLFRALLDAVLLFFVYYRMSGGNNKRKSLPLECPVINSVLEVSR